MIGTMGKRPERGGRAKGIGELVVGAGGRAFRAQGFAEGALVARWAEIVGDVYARHSTPEALRFTGGAREGGTLHVRVTGAFAPRLAIVEGEVVARVNRYLGRAVVARLNLRHADAPPVTAAPPPPAAATPLDAATSGSLRAVSDPGLRAALEALAARVAMSRGPPVFD